MILIVVILFFIFTMAIGVGFGIYYYNNNNYEETPEVKEVKEIEAREEKRAKMYEPIREEVTTTPAEIESKKELDKSIIETRNNVVGEIAKRELVISNSKVSVGQEVGNVVVAIIAQIILEKVLTKLFEKSLTKFVNEIGEMIMEKLIKKVMMNKFMQSVVKAGSKAKEGIMALLNMGKKLNQKMATLTTRMVAKETAEIAAKEGAEAAAKTAAKTAAKVAAGVARSTAKMIAKGLMSLIPTNPVDAALMIFDIISIILDSTDGGGYMVLDKWKIIVDSIKAEIKKSLTDDVEYPLVVGPLDELYLQAAPDEPTPDEEDKLSDEEYAKADVQKMNLYTYKIKNKIQDYIKADQTIVSLVTNIVFEELQTIISNYLEEGIFDDEKSILNEFVNDSTKFYEKVRNSLTNDKKVKFDEYRKSMADRSEKEITNYINNNMDAFIDKAVADLCTEYGGIMTEDGKCSYTEKNCDTKYPLKDNEIDRAWGKEAGKCFAKNAAIAVICYNNNLKYDADRGICVITSEMCKTKGGSPKKLSDGTIDCKIPADQAVFENIFGVTVVRGLKQVFDPNQYEKCRDDEIDTGYTCRKKCAKGDKDVAGICYKDPPRIVDCDPGYTSTGTICQAKPKSVGVGTVPKLRGAAACKDDEIFQDGLCYKRCRPGYKSDGMTICHWDDPRVSYMQPYWPCEKHYKDNGTLTCQAVYPFKQADFGSVPNDCGEGEQYVAGLCFPKCREGYRNKAGDAICYENCNEDEVDVGLMCRKKCKEGYKDVAGVCWKNLPKGSSYSVGVGKIPKWDCSICNDLKDVVKGAGTCTGNDPLKCKTKGCGCIKSTKKKKTRKCKKSCPTGYRKTGVKCGVIGSCVQNCAAGLRDDGTSCWEDAKTTCEGGKVATRKCTPQCDSDRRYRDGMCYKNCEEDYVGAGAICTYKNKLSYVPETRTKNSYMRTSSKTPTCPDDKEKISELCYKKCPKDLDASGNDLGTGYVRTSGLLCLPVKGNQYQKEKKACGEGYNAWGGTCWRKYYNRGGGRMPYACEGDRTLVDGVMCYKSCSKFDTDKIKYKHVPGLPTECAPEKGLSYTRVNAMYIPKTRSKKRAVPYSVGEQFVKKETVESLTGRGNNTASNPVSKPVASN
jgi:hypothetical protein